MPAATIDKRRELLLRRKELLERRRAILMGTESERQKPIIETGSPRSSDMPIMKLPFKDKGIIGQAKDIMSAIPMAAEAATRLPGQLFGQSGALMTAPNMIETPQELAGSEFVQETGAAGAGEYIGRRLGAAAMARLGPPGMAAGAIVGGAVGSTVGLTTKRLIKGEEMTIGDAALEFGMSVAPEVARKGFHKLSEGAQFIASRTKVGRQTASDYLGVYARSLSKATLLPPPEFYEKGLWDAVRNSGLQLGLGGFSKGLRVGKFSRADMSIILREVRKVGAGPEDQFPQIGEAFSKALKNAYHGNIRYGRGLDIGGLTHVRSVLSDRILQLKNTATGARGNVLSTLERFRDLMNDVMENGPVLLKGKRFSSKTGFSKHLEGVNAQALLREARKTTSAIKDYHDIEDFLLTDVVKVSQGMDHATIHLDRLYGALSGGKRISKSAQAAADAIKRRDPSLESQLRHFLGTAKEIGIDVHSADDIHGPINVVIWLLRAGPLARARAFRLMIDKAKPLALSDLAAVGIVPARWAIRDEARKNEKKSNGKARFGIGGPL